MPISITHLFESEIPDGEDTTLVQPSDWNNEHVVSGAVAADDLASTTSGSEGAKLVGFQHDDTVYDMIRDLLNRGILHGFNIVNTGGLNITWTSGDLWNPVTGLIVEADAQETPQACTDNAINYLKWVSGTSLTLGTQDASGDQILVARIDTFDGAVHTIRTNEFLSSVVSSARRSLRSMFPLIALQGLIISEKSGSNTWDVVSSEGSYIEDGHVYVPVNAIDSTVTQLTRIFHSGGAWSHDHNSQIDTTMWDNGTNLAAVSANKYYKSIFLIGDDIIHWIYPQAQYDTLAQAIAGPLPVVPTGLSKHIQTTAVVLRGNASAFPAAGNEAWIDIRPKLTGSAFGPITDHGALAGLGDDDHPQYLLATSATTTPTASKIPIAGEDGKIASGWIPSGVGGGADFLVNQVFS